MNRTLETAIRFVNLTASGLLAGSLGFGEAALVPGWQEELPRHRSNVIEALRHLNYYNAIGPVALGTAVTLAVGTKTNITKPPPTMSPKPTTLLPPNGFDRTAVAMRAVANGENPPITAKVCEASPRFSAV